MASVSEDDLQNKRDKNSKLREQIAAAQAKAAANIEQLNFAIESTQLDAETARLEAQLRAAKGAASAAAAKEGAAGPLAAVTEQLKVAEAAKNNPIGPVDTNAGTDSADEKKE